MDRKVFFTSSLDDLLTEEITNILPQWRTHLCEINITKKKITELEIKIYIAAKTKEEIKEWISEYEAITKTSHSIRSTDKANGKYILFKQRIVCHHNIISSHTLQSDSYISRKDKNCPSRMTLTLHSVKKRYQGKNKEKGVLLAEMPCEIDLQVIHNHNTHTVEALKIRKPSLQVREKLLQFFHRGHSPMTALQLVRMDIQMNCEDYKAALLDRGQCPDYQYCYHLYGSELKKKFEPFQLDMPGKRYLQYKLEQCNAQEGDMCAQALFCESNIVICMCTPLMKRVHEHIRATSEIVFINTAQTREGYTLFMLTTHSTCGELPLGAFVTSDYNSCLIRMGFQVLKELLGNSVFGGNPEGPQSFVIDDCLELQSAVCNAWPASNVLLCFFHVLQTVWKWLNENENSIPLEMQCTLFQDFKAIMFAETLEECCSMYENTRMKSDSEFPNYCAFLDEMWGRRQQWALAYRNGLIVRGNNTSYAEAVSRILRDNILDHIKGFDVVQVVDFIFTSLITCYEKKLLHAVCYGQRKNPLKRIVEQPSDEIKQSIMVYYENTFLVPSRNTTDLYYVVNLDVLLCSCPDRKSARVCQHIDWAGKVLFSGTFDSHINSNTQRKSFYTIATNEDPAEMWPSDQLQDLNFTEEIDLLVFTSESLHPTEGYVTMSSDSQIEIVNVEMQGESGYQTGTQHIFGEMPDLCNTSFTVPQII